MDSNNGLIESSQFGPKPKIDSCSVNPWEDEVEVPLQATGSEVPLQATGSEVLLLPYKEESVANEAEFDGFGDLFNEPEVSSTPIVPEHSSESDPDEVDNSDSVVSVESCLAHFIKPELLSNDNAWECENCSKILLRQRSEAKKKQAKLVSKGESLVSDNGKMDSSGQNCRETEGGQTDEANPIVESREQNGMEQSQSSTDYKSFDQESSSCPAGSSSNVEETSSSTGYATAREQLVDSESSISCGAEEDGLEDEERKSIKVKVKRDATKRVLIDKAPPILTIHLKRFSQDARGRLSKLNGHVNFGEILDLRPYMDSRCADREEFVYRLLGVVEHSGSMRGGHYVSYVKGDKGKRENEKGDMVWYYASDAYVREASLEEVLRSEAYILFYEKI